LEAREMPEGGPSAFDAESALTAASEGSLELHHPADSMEALLVDRTIACVEHADAVGE
jgi:hypothetical protein